MMIRWRPLLLVACASVCFCVGVAGCGRRSAPLTAGDGLVPDSGVGFGDGGTRSDRGRDRARADLSPRLLCPNAEWKEPTPFLTYPDRHATAPSLAVVSPGDPQQPPRLALQVFASGGSSYAHPDIEVARVRVGLPWPEQTVVEKASILWGIESHGWGEMAGGWGSPAKLALGWHGDSGGTGRPQFRTLDGASWTPGAPVDIAPKGEAVLSLAAGGQISPKQGPGYAIIWRDYLNPPTQNVIVVPVLAILDGAGQRVLGPYQVAAGLGYPGRAPSATWNGSSYLVATSYSDCVEGADQACVPRAVVATRFVPPSATSKGGLTMTASIVSLDSETRPRRAAITSRNGLSWVAWAEGGSDESGLHRVRLARLDAKGNLFGQPVLITDQARPVYAVALYSTSLGIILVWPEDGDAAQPDNQPGRSRLVVHWLDDDGKPLHASRQVDITRFHTYGKPSVVAIAQPRGLVFTWAGRLTNGYDGAFLAGTFCGP